MVIKQLLFALKNPSEQYRLAQEKSFKFWRYLLLLAAITFVGSVVRAIPLYTSAQSAAGEIAEALPTFQIMDNQLISNHKSYVHVTDSFLFFFDPDEEMDTTLIEKNTSQQQTPVSFGLLKDKATLTILNSTQEFSYEQIPALDEALVRNILTSLQQGSISAVLTVLIVMFISMLIVFILEVMPIILINYISVAISRVWNLTVSASVTLLTLTLPIILVTIINSLGIVFSYQSNLLTIFSLVLFQVNVYYYRKEQSN
ncbi:DUF1189 family protein [Dolosigranulum savutiense]|uniref:DUF1189 family protein n=1 Tax=Dolosigranulum savutiense TaxID=3110288 RepID=A0AB74U6A6_9LACT